MTLGSNQPATPSTTERVYQTIVDLHALNRIPTREVICKETGLRFSVVDDSVKRLIDQERIRRVVNGVFEPYTIKEDRPVSATVLPNGVVKAEVGDSVTELSPGEGRSLAKLLAGLLLGYGR